MNNENQFNQVDLLFDPVRALAHVIRMRNITLTNKPDHEFVAYFNEIETTLRKMREKNEKLAAMVDYMTHQQDKFSTSTPVNVVEHSEKAHKNYFNFIQAPNNDGSNDIHKATFSSELVRKLLRLYATKGQVIYDSFMGTGTTAVACIIEDMDYIGSELSKRYVDFSNERIKPLLAQTKLF